MNMTCFFCKGEMKPGTTIHTVQLKNCVVVIKNVPCMKCEQCGEVILSADTIEKIERILQTVEKAVAEITVVNFPEGCRRAERLHGGSFCQNDCFES